MKWEAAGSPAVTNLVTYLTATVGVVLLGFIAIMTLKFILRHEFGKLLGFLGLALVVLTVFFHVTILQTLAGQIAAAIGK